MKTLDEVIKALEYCTGFDFVRCQDCPGYSEPDCRIQDDALHYLKEYQGYLIGKEISEAFDEAFSEIYNPPLTWDELCTMEGKPVWIEAESLSVGINPYWKGWYIINSFSDDEFMYCNDGFEWAKEMQGRLWQAYRKERK